MGGPSLSFFLIDKFQLSPFDTVHQWLNFHYKKSLKMVKNQEKYSLKRDLGQGKYCFEYGDIWKQVWFQDG